MSFVKNLRTSFERFCYKNRDKGIPNLMLYICIGSGIVYLLSMINGGSVLYEFLRFDKALILQGQVWRLFTYVLTYTPGSSFLALIFLYFFYSLSRGVEYSMGTFRFNLYYFSGVILMDVFAMVFCPTTDITISGAIVPAEYFSYFIYSNMAYYLHLSMVLAFSTMYPDAQFMVMFVIPVKAWVLALIDLVLIAIDVFNMCYPTMLFPHCLFPLIGILNYILFFGPDMGNLLPLSWRVKLRRKKQRKQTSGPKVIPFTKAESTGAAPKDPYTHRCTVCGRTDTEFPDLEFRYCSRCQGYHCYCEDHISNHAHIE